MLSTQSRIWSWINEWHQKLGRQLYSTRAPSPVVRFFMLWTIWKHKNDYQFGKKQRYFRLAQRARMLTNEFWVIYRKRKKEDDAAKQFDYSWKKPTKNELK